MQQGRMFVSVVYWFCFLACAEYLLKMVKWRSQLLRVAYSNSKDFRELQD